MDLGHLRKSKTPLQGGVLDLGLLKSPDPGSRGGVFECDVSIKGGGIYSVGTLRTRALHEPNFIAQGGALDARRSCVATCAAAPAVPAAPNEALRASSAAGEWKLRAHSSAVS